MSYCNPTLLALTGILNIFVKNTREALLVIDPFIIILDLVIPSRSSRPSSTLRAPTRLRNTSLFKRVARLDSINPSQGTDLVYLSLIDTNLVERT
jgi:hypothetical protein